MPSSTSLKRARIVNILLLIPVLGLILLLALLVQKRQVYFLGWLTGCIFYGLPAILVSVLVFAFWLPIARRTQITLLVWVTGLALLVSETFLQVLPIWSPTESQARQLASAKLGRSFDSRTKRQVIEDYRAAGQPAVPVVPVAVHFVDTKRPLELQGRQVVPLSGISKALTVYDNENGEYLVYQSDEYGFTNPLGAFAPKTCDVVVVGDSFAHGAAVPVGKDSVSLIRQQFPATINLGYVAGGPLAYLGALTEHALPRHPRIVLWYHFEGNDFQNLFNERQTLLSRYLQDDFQQGLAELQTDIDGALREIVERNLKMPDSTERSEHWLWRVATLQELRARLLNMGRRKDVQSMANMQYFEQVVTKANERVQKSGGAMKLVYLPAFDRYAGRDESFRRQEVQVLAVMSKLNIPVINIAAAFEKNPDPLSFFPLRLYGHYNEEGYALVAQTVVEALRKGE